MNPTAPKPLLKYLICVLLTGIIFAAFAGVARCSFIGLDDRIYVVDNPNIQHGLSWGAIQWALKGIYAGYWIPVTWLSHILDCQLYGLNPAGHHLTNLAIHLANTVLLFLLLDRLTARTWPSAFVALLFGIHPMHVESVAWIAERKDVLSAFFFLLTLLAYTRYAELQSRPSHEAQQSHPPSSILHLRFRWLAYALALIFFVLGLMSKPMLVTLPFVLLLLDFWPLQRFDALVASKRESETLQRFNALTLQRLLMEKVPFFLLSAFFSYVTFIAQRSAGAVKPVVEFSLANRLGHVPVGYSWYFFKLFWPANLSVFYSFRKTADPALEILSATILLLVITAFALARLRKNPYLLFGWLWFLGMLVPVIGFVQSGDQAYADRFAYLPYIGLSIIIAWGVPEMLAKMPSRGAIFWASAVMIGVVCSWRTVAEVGYWKDGLTLLNRAVALDPRNEMAWATLGFEYEIRNNSDKAIDCERRALSLDSNFYLAWNNLGDFLARKKDYAGAEQAYQSALPAIQYTGDRAYSYNRLGDAFAGEQKYSQAIAAYQNSLAIDAKQDITEVKLGQCLLRAQQPDSAAVAFQNAIALQPNRADAYVGLGMISQGADLDSDAIAQYRNALKAEPNAVLALNNLAWILASDSDPALRNGPEAVSLAERACELTHYQEAVFIGTLAAAYAEAGRFDDAVAAAQKAHDLALAHGDSHHAARNAQLMELYKSHRAYHMEVKN